jgi:hypothetical protein
MASILEAGQGKKLRSAKDRVLNPLPLLASTPAASTPAASAAVSAPNPGMQGLLLGWANKLGTAGRKPEEVYASNIIDYVKDFLEKKHKFTKEEKRLIRALDIDLLSQYSAQIDILKPKMDEVLTLDFKNQLIRDLPSLPKRVVSVATAPAVSGGGMGAPAPMTTPLPAPKPGATGSATGSTRPPMLPPPPAGPKPAAPTPIVATPPAPAASAASSGSVSPSVMSDADKLAKAEQLITKYGITGIDLLTFNGFVIRVLEGKFSPFDMPGSVFAKNPTAGSISETDKAKAEFLIATGQTAGAKPADIAKWKTKLGLA